VDKKALLTAMLGSEHLRREVMEILYPVVLNRLREFWRENASARAGFAEVPMLLEAGWPGQDAVDLVVGVQCPEGVRRERLAAGRGWDQALMDAVDAWQWSWEKKLAGCALVVDNDGSLDDLGRAVGSVRQSLARVRREKVKSLLAWLAGRGYAKKVQAP
jgi:23S rRNA pseudouridine1911/1915/1917 synthase